MGTPEDVRFDPLGILAALQRHRASFVLIGGFARVVQGTDELTRGVDITPWIRPTNLANLELALADIDAVPADGKPLGLGVDDTVVELRTTRGQLLIVPRPAGTRGYEDLRRAATYEHLGKGVRPQVASVGDLIRMAGAHGTEPAMQQVIQLRKIAELQRELGVGLEL